MLNSNTVKVSNDLDISRFYKAHEQSYDTALTEVQAGRKTSHWMWYIFPQIKGLGHSSMSEYYAIRNIAEARIFLDDGILGAHLIEISNALLHLNQNDPVRIFGMIDAKKLRSSMTLFAYISDKDSVFHKVLDKYYQGNPDGRTLSLIV